MVGQDRLTTLSQSVADRLEIPHGPVVVALSGGADSAALLWLLVRQEIDVRAVHVIHGLPTSAFMSTAAGQVAAQCGVRLDMVVVEPAGSSEGHLREARLAALLERAGDFPVVMAHTADDQVETVLMRILRGTGLDGLRGISPARGRILHPLLRVGRAETRELATLAGLPFRDDPANEDRAILRNRIRLDLLPVAEAVMGAPVGEALARLAETARAEVSILDGRMRAIPVERRADQIRIPVGVLRAVGDVMAGRVLRAALSAAHPPYPPDLPTVRRLLDVVHGRVAAMELSPGLRAVVLDAHLVIGPAITSDAGGDSVMLRSGVTEWGGWRFTAAVSDGPAVVPLSMSRLVIPEPASLQVRTWNADDRVTDRRVGQALADAGIPAEVRPTWPIVTVDDEPVWIPGVRRRVWPGATRRRYLGVSAMQEPRWQPFEL